MFLKVIRYVSIPLLLIASIATPFAGRYEPLWNLAICLGALGVVQHAVRTRAYLWAAGFAGIAIVFSPMILIFKLFLLMTSILVVSFVALLDTWKRDPAPVV